MNCATVSGPENSICFARAARNDDLRIFVNLIDTKSKEDTYMIEKIPGKMG